MRPKASTVERELARIASRAHGVVTRAQALRAGITEAEIKHRLGTGALIPVHRGVYRLGHSAANYEAHYLAAVFACGDGALLSGRASAYLHGVVKGSPPPPEVTTRTARRVRGVRTRRSPQLDGRDGARSRGIPVTTVERTLVDIAAVLPFDDLARACHEAGIRYGTTPERVESALARRPNALGAKRLRAILHGEGRVALSKLERRVLDLLRDDGRVLPETNCPIGSYRVDCRWPDLRLTVEIDGYRYHRSRHAWEQDRRREREARARGDDFRRFTYGDVFEHPEAMLAELRRVLPKRGARFRSQDDQKSAQLAGKPERT